MVSSFKTKGRTAFCTKLGKLLFHANVQISTFEIIIKNIYSHIVQKQVCSLTGLCTKKKKNQGNGRRISLIKRWKIHRWEAWKVCCLRCCWLSCCFSLHSKWPRPSMGRRTSLLPVPDSSPDQLGILTRFWTNAETFLLEPSQKLQEQEHMIT